MDCNRIIHIDFAIPKDIKRQVSILGLISAYVIGIIFGVVFGLRGN